MLIEEPDSRARISPQLVALRLGLSPAESRVAAALAEGLSVREIAAVTGRKEGSVRWQVSRIYQKLGLSRQANLVRLVLSVTELPGSLGVAGAEGLSFGRRRRQPGFLPPNAPLRLSWREVPRSLPLQFLSLSHLQNPNGTSRAKYSDLIFGDVSASDTSSGHLQHF